MAKAVITIKTNKEVKKNAQKLAEELGLSLSDVINASLRNFIRTREVHFSFIPRMTSELERLLGVAEKDIAKKRNLSSAFSARGEIDEYLDSL